MSLTQSLLQSFRMGSQKKNWPLLRFICWILLLLLLLALSLCVQGFSVLPPRRQASSSWLQLRLNMAPTATNAAAPLYITVGPQCAGKTTLLRQLEQELAATTIEDIALDDQPGVYVQVPTEYFLQQREEESGKDDRFLQSRVQDKTLASRIYDDGANGELRAILQRLDGRLSQADFCERIRHLHAVQQQQQRAETTRSRSNPSNSNETTRHQSFQAMMATTTLVMDALQKFLDETQDCVLPTHIQLFCVESLFRAHPDTNRTGIEAAHDRLWHVARNVPTTSLAWGNTNTRPREYKEALAAAATTNRPVHFVVYADDNKNNASSSDGGGGGGVFFFLPKVGLPELQRRNLSRLLQTGKYVPCRAVVEANDRVLNLVQSAQHNLPPNFTKLQLDQELARMIHFEMKPDRTVRRMNNTQNNRRKPR